MYDNHHLESQGWQPDGCFSTFSYHFFAYTCFGIDPTRALLTFDVALTRSANGWRPILRLQVWRWGLEIGWAY